MISVGVLLFPGFQMLNLCTGTVFEFANLEVGRPFYRVELVSEHGGSISSSMGFSINSVPFGQTTYDTLLVVGDNDAMDASPGMLAYLQQAMGTTRRMTSACTGAFYLAAAGLLDGVKATTHWYHAHAFR